jgi:hypothetical protein
MQVPVSEVPTSQARVPAMHHSDQLFGRGPILVCGPDEGNDQTETLL